MFENILDNKLLMKYGLIDMMMMEFRYIVWFCLGFLKEEEFFELFDVSVKSVFDCRWVS